MRFTRAEAVTADNPPTTGRAPAAAAASVIAARAWARCLKKRSVCAQLIESDSSTD